MALPEPKGKTRSGGSSRAGKLPPPEGGDFDPFLKAEDIGKLGSRATIEVMSAPEEVDSEFSDMQMQVRYKKVLYSMGLKTASGNYARLYKHFGNKPSKWHGKIEVEIKHHKANDYVAVVG
jgi:hypothetical protein